MTDEQQKRWDGQCTDPNTGQTYMRTVTSGPTGSAKFDPHAGTCPDGNVSNVELSPNAYNTNWPKNAGGALANYDWNNLNPIWPNKTTDTRDAEIVALKAQVVDLQQRLTQIRCIAILGI